VRSAFLLTGLLIAQDATIRVTTRLVQVNVVVRDSHGPVAGLAKKDFKIFDKGKDQPVALFSVSSSADQTPAKSAAVPLGVFTNRPAAESSAPLNGTVLLIDVLNTDVSDQQIARRQLLKFLTTLEPGRRVAIYILGTRLHVLQDFTSDPRLLAQAAQKFQGQPSNPLGASNMPLPGAPVTATEEMNTGMTDNPAEAVAREALAEMRDAATVDRVSITLTALEQIANHLASVPGRKSLLWISGSFPFFLIDDERHNFLAANRENRTFHLEIERATRALSAADTAIYPVDARGLLSTPAADGTQHDNGFTNPRGRAFGTRKNGQIGVMQVDTPEGLESMQALAAGTGGRAFYNTNDIKGAIGRAIADADLTYTLGFYADSSAVDGFHEIKVKVDRPGLDIRYRKGYLAASIKAPTGDDVASLLHDAVASALDSSTIGLIAVIDNTRIALHVNFADLRLEKQNGKWSGAIDVAYVSQSADGRSIALTSKKVTLDLNDDLYAAKRRDGLVLEQIVERPKGTARIRIAVLDERSGVTGAVSIALAK
jgi:VWFA-related protein